MTLFTWLMKARLLVTITRSMILKYVSSLRVTFDSTALLKSKNEPFWLKLEKLLIYVISLRICLGSKLR